MAENWNCDGSGPHTEGTVKKYPLGGGANLILCIRCWARENQYRFNRGDPEKWPQENWHAAEIYPS
jgi:hypothetical protein